MNFCGINTIAGYGYGYSNKKGTIYGNDYGLSSGTGLGYGFGDYGYGFKEGDGESAKIVDKDKDE